MLNRDADNEICNDASGVTSIHEIDSINSNSSIYDGANNLIVLVQLSLLFLLIYFLLANSAISIDRFFFYL